MIELESWEVEECIEALNQSVVSVKQSIKVIHPAQELTIKALNSIVERQEDLAETLQNRLWER